MIKPQFSPVSNVEYSIGMATAHHYRRRQTSTPEYGRRHFPRHVQAPVHHNSETKTAYYWEKYTEESRPISAKALPKHESYRDICRELHGIEKALQLCHQDLTGTHIKTIMRDMNRSSHSDQVAALNELFQRLLAEMVHLKTLLSYCNQMVQNAVDASNSTLSEQNLFSHAATNTDDFVHVKGPLTENLIMNTLQERFNTHRNHTNIGPILIAVNPFGLSEIEQDIQHEANNAGLLKKLLTQALDQLFHTQTSQLLILSGESCSGKSFTAQVLIHQLLQVTCGGVQTDLAKQLLSSITVLRSLGKARTTNNTNSSRVAKLYEFHFSNRIVSKAKIQCYPLDMSRIVRPKEGERNFHIFYQLFAGLNPKDRAKLQLQTHNAHELRYLYNYPVGDQSEIDVLRSQFQLWKAALSVLGIPFDDVSRVLATILLLGNVHFMEKSTNVLEVQGGDFELKSVALLLGVPYTSLFRSLTKRTKLVRGELIMQPCTASQANSSRDALSKCLYSRTLSAILRRCNSSRKPASQENSPNSSNESLTKTANNLKPQQDVSPISPVAAGNRDSSKIIGIADLFGFETSKCNGMEEICCNLCSETIQNFYTAHIFKSTERYYREEELGNEIDFDYVDNSLCIELLTSQPTGILSYLDRETSDVLLGLGSPTKLMEKLHNKHSGHAKFTSSCDKLEFAVAHHTTEVVYDVKDLFLSNDDSIVDDVIRIFSKENCNFGFVTHLFASDLKSTFSHEKPDGENFLHKISQSFNQTNQSEDNILLIREILLPPLEDKKVPQFKVPQNVSVPQNSGLRTLSQDFQGKLDGLLETIVQCQPSFIFCLKSNCEQNKNVFDQHVVSKQVKYLQIFETIYLMRSGYTHRMRHISFAQRYFAIQDDRLTQEDAMDIVRSYYSLIASESEENPNKQFFIGKKHVLFSDVVWQNLEKDRREKDAEYNMRRNKIVEEDVILSPEQEVRYEDRPTILVEELTEAPHLPGEIDMSTPPPIPKRRSYTVIDNKKIIFPQTRVMKKNYRDTRSGKEVVFNYGETIRVVGASPKSGFLTVESKNKSGCVPYKLTALIGDHS